MRRYDSQKADIAYQYRKRIEPIVGNGSLRNDLVRKLEVILGEVLPSEELSAGDLAETPIDYDSFDCSRSERNRIKNALDNADVKTYGDLVHMFSIRGDLRISRGIGKKSEEVIFRDIKVKGLAENFKL
jgi:hypothetical protein